MKELLYEMYKRNLKMIEDQEWVTGEPEKEFLKDIIGLVAFMDEKNPSLKSQYERESNIQKSFTEEQQDFICWQIGEWYLKWKDNMATGEGRCHRLGFAKEELKTMICGE